MSNLTFFEQLDLRLAMLVAHQNRIGAELEIVRPVDIGQDYRPQIETSSELLQQLRSLLDGYPEEIGSPTALLESTDDVSAGAFPQTGEAAAALRKAENLADSLLQLPYLSADQFDSFGFFVCQWVRSYRTSPSYVRMRRESEHPQRVLPVRGSLQSIVRDRRLQKGLEDVFAQLLYVLSLIRHTQQVLDARPRQQLILMMVRCNECCQSLITKMEQLQHDTGSGCLDLKDMLSWSACALRIELNRVLKGDLHHIDAEPDRNDCYDRLDRATGILLNGFDQITRQMLSRFEPEFDGGGLLDDLRQKYVETCRLRDRLSGLQSLALQMERSPSTETYGRLLHGMKAFERNSVPLLYRRDRRLFEQFSRELRDIRLADYAFVSHRLQIFLSTLLTEVQHRNVLAHFEPAALASTG